MTNFYVYYRVDELRIGTLKTDIGLLLKRIEDETGVRGRWMRRRDDPSTYMEVYEGVADSGTFETSLARESAGLGLERRIERFVSA